MSTGLVRKHLDRRRCLVLRTNTCGAHHGKWDIRIQVPTVPFVQHEGMLIRDLTFDQSSHAVVPSVMRYPLERFMTFSTSYARDGQYLVGIRGFAPSSLLLGACSVKAEFKKFSTLAVGCLGSIRKTQIMWPSSKCGRDTDGGEVPRPGMCCGGWSSNLAGGWMVLGAHPLDSACPLTAAPKRVGSQWAHPFVTPPEIRT